MKILFEVEIRSCVYGCLIYLSMLNPEGLWLYTGMVMIWLCDGFDDSVNVPIKSLVI